MSNVAKEDIFDLLDYDTYFNLMNIKHNLNKEVNYEILELETEKEIYCMEIEDKNYDDFLYKIRST